MKYFLPLLAILACFGAHAQTEASEQTLTKLEDQRLKAIISRDSIFLSSLYDAAYRGILTNGREVTKAGVIEFQMASNPYVKVSLENVQATVHGNMAITTGKQVNRSKGGTVLGVSRFVRVYLKRETGWKVVYSQGTLIAGEEM